MAGGGPFGAVLCYHRLAGVHRDDHPQLPHALAEQGFGPCSPLADHARMVGEPGRIRLYSSRLVVQECQAGDPRAAADRLAAMAGIPLLEQAPEVADLAEALLSGLPLSDRAVADALHIAIAAVHGLDYLLTWNCTHIANVMLRPRIEAVCRAAGYEPPLICTPEELPAGGHESE